MGKEQQSLVFGIAHMNNISILPRICMYFFQQQNLLHDGVKNKIGKEVTEEEIHENVVSTEDNQDEEDVKEEKNDTL